MKLRAANKELKNAIGTNKEPEVSALILTKLTNNNSKNVLKIMERSGILRKLDEAQRQAERVSTTVSSSGEIMVSVDGGARSTYSPKTIDFYLKSVLSLKESGFYYLYRALLSDADIVSTMACAHAAMEHDLAS